MIGPKQLGPLGGDHHHRPACLAIADDRGLAVGFGVERDDALEKRGLCCHDVLNGLTRDRLGQKADEVAGMARLEGDADLALRLEAANAGTVAGAWIDDDEGPLLLIDVHAFRRRDAGQHVVDRTRKLAPVHHELGAEFENVRGWLGGVLLVLLAPLLQDVEEKNPALPGIDPIRPGIQCRIPPGDRGKWRCLRLGWGLLNGHLMSPPRNKNQSGRAIRPENIPPLEILRAMLAALARRQSEGAPIRSRPFQRDADVARHAVRKVHDLELGSCIRAGEAACPKTDTSPSAGRSASSPSLAPAD